MSISATATHEDRAAPAADGAPPPLMGSESLDDESKFKIYRRVPILDVNEDAERGNVDEDMLRTIAKNSNKRVDGGDPPSLILGHTRRKQTLIVLRPDGSKVVFPATEEEGQPDIVGFSKNHAVGEYKGKPCLYGDFHIHKEHLDKARKHIYRSIERVEKVGDDDDNSHYFDRVALLKTPPQRDLGILQYEQSTGGCGTTPNLLRVCYARSFPPLEDTGPSGSKTPDEADSGPPAETAPSASPPAAPDETPSESTSKPEEPMPQDDMNATATEDASAPAPAQDMKIGDMSAGDFVQLLAEAFRSVLSEHLEEPDSDEAPPEGEGEADPDPDPDSTQTDYDSQDLQVPEDEDEPLDDRSVYEASEPSCNNTFTPGGTNPPSDEEKRRMYEESERIRRVNYAKQFEEQREINELLINAYTELQLENRRVKYEKRLTQLEAEGFEIDRGEELDSLKPESPDDYEASQERRIRKCYRRSPVGTRTHVGVEAPSGGGTRPAPLSKEQGLELANYAMTNGCSIAEAKAALKYA